VSGPWVMRFDARPAAGLRLYCVPFAGAGAPAYRPWAPLLPPAVELRAVQPPGRQDRIREAPFTACRDLVGALAGALAPELGDLPFALFGHSMGGLVCFELARELRRRGAPMPVLVGVSAWPAPQRPRAVRPVADLPDEALAAHVHRLGGMPDAVLGEPELLASVLPTLRADYRVCETYAYEPEPPLDCPITVFGALADPLAAPSDLEAWAAQTTRPLSLRTYQGHHFYLLERLETVVGALVADLGEALTGQRIARATGARG
jgi:medium-chain acyl-[acyl-carrier-protein] hydrolase